MIDWIYVDWVGEKRDAITVTNESNKICINYHIESKPEWKGYAIVCDEKKVGVGKTREETLERMHKRVDKDLVKLVLNYKKV